MDIKIAGATLVACLSLSACMSPAPVRLAAGCQDIAFPIYFAEGSDALTPVATQAVATAAQKSHGCHVGQVKVTGLADAKGGPQANLDLSQRRAASVAAVLATDGLPAPTFDLAAQGDQGAVLASGAAAPMQRRVDVTIHFVR